MNSYIIEWDHDAQAWATYVFVEGIHDVSDDPATIGGSEEYFATLDGAARRITAWRALEQLRQYMPPPNADDVVVWEDFGEFLVNTPTSQVVTRSLTTALTIAHTVTNTE